jgi:NMD protein affecting ribosome stability and mRNA decay
MSRARKPTRFCTRCGREVSPRNCASLRVDATKGNDESSITETYTFTLCSTCSSAHVRFLQRAT